METSGTIETCPPPTTPCAETSCLIPEITSECTKECLVVACDDPNHGGFRCQVTDGSTVCDGSCISATDCNDCHGLEEIFQCCTDYHSYFAEPRQCPKHVESKRLSYGRVISPQLFPSVNRFPGDGLLCFIEHFPVVSQRHPVLSYTCMWANCSSMFNTLSELVGHVNLQHLRVTDAQNKTSETTNTLSCHWGDCAMYPSPSSIPSSSSGGPDNDLLGVLTTHLMQDHLGLNHPLPASTTLQSGTSDRHTTGSTDSGSQLSNTPVHECSGSHVCKWQSCTHAFTSCSDLTDHIASVHVGSGKAHYECLWEGCPRNGKNGFSSKQKISRHLQAVPSQSHTGHRPFQCDVCHQNFSEAATLQQHTRRHTQERPYVCDHPGCGKAFAITGALTIHKRTHNGLRPFKCTYCDKAFSESSNLSKHLRTHTGARPYMCTHDGCGKSFARPDQLARHLGVHRKKST
ncbi:hypothetical protein BU15DRAFT_85600 [Melanogaster broomeanus]|nr:hypothetical protein BU15DRAFT_85600 [Melanogaster broomeanus]